jgi:hypothetical protein
VASREEVVADADLRGLAHALGGVRVRKQRADGGAEVGAIACVDEAARAAVLDLVLDAADA